MAEVFDIRHSTIHNRFRDRFTLPLLLLLTIVAGVLRFSALGRPTMWGDEAATYGRVAGTYQELLDQLVDASFPPLHYELEWWIGQGMPLWGHFDTPAAEGGLRTFTPTAFLVPGGIRLTPTVMRLVPAAAGTLFVPALFFVAVQLFGRRVALWTAVLACFSAYLLVYARDAKMYMHFWLAVTVHVGCALAWVRTRRPIAWAGWVLSGIVAVGLHGSGFVMLLIDVLILFFSPRQYWRHLYTIVPAYVWSMTLAVGRALGWVGLNRGWRERRDWLKVAVWQRRAVRRFHWPIILGFAAGVGLMLAAAFGPLGYYSAFSQRIQRVTASEGQAVDPSQIGIGWVGPYNAGRKLPDYLLYTASAYLTGWEWPRPVDQAKVNVRTLRLLQGGTIALLTLLAVGVVPWRKLFQPARARLDRITQDNRVWRPFVGRRAWWLAIWLTAVPWVTYTQSTAFPETVFDGVARLMLTKPPAVEWPRMDLPAATGGSAWTTGRQVWTAFAARVPDAWHRYTAAWTRDNLSRPAVIGAAILAIGGVALVLWKRRAVGRGTVRLVGIGLLLAALGTLVGALPQKADGDLWMPRYLATMLPAFLILTAVLIDRQPKALRWATLVLFVAINGAQFTGRLFGSEPPTDLIAADIVASQPKSVLPQNPESPAFRAYVNFKGFTSPEPGGGTLSTQPGRAYLHLLGRVPNGDIRGVRLPGYETYFQINRFLEPAQIERDLANSPAVKRFVIWNGLPIGEIDQTDAVADKLKGKFRRVNEELWTARDHWRWIERFQIRRRTYERIN